MGWDERVAETIRMWSLSPESTVLVKAERRGAYLVVWRLEGRGMFLTIEDDELARRVARQLIRDGVQVAKSMDDAHLLLGIAHAVKRSS